MRVSYSLGSLLTINQILDCTDKLSTNPPDTVWIPETWGMENFSMLSSISQRITNAKIGSSIINIYSRSPTAIAMGATTVDTLSNGRLILGLGTSSNSIIENFHGYEFRNPLARMKEYVEVIRKIISGEKIDHQGKFFSLKGFTLLIEPIRKTIPIYLAAVNQKMVDLTWEIGDGVIFYLRPKNELKETIAKMQVRKKIDVTCQIITAISEDTEKAINRAKSTVAFYVSVGKIYREFLEKNGYKTECQNIFEEFKKSGFESNHEFVTDAMVRDLTIHGSPDEATSQLKKFRETGIDLPIIQFNPIDDVTKNFELVKDTFSGDLK